ncbi:GIY-YIG nuclease family protein [Paraburkholderia tropica]|uniref:GIY-YIG nuclease family protein n=1 Tax=Paraburkholderia tropica TaxID=92647 RepID=UPI003D2D5C2B
MLTLDKYAGHNNVLYAFVVGDEVKYVGKTTMTLRSRMNGYQWPGADQSTNIKCNNYIREALGNNQEVLLYVLPDGGLMHYGQFHINLAAGLEDSIIASLEPQWNGRQQIKDAQKNESAGAEIVAAPNVVTSSFAFTLQPSYQSTGFFNVPADHDHEIGSGGERAELYIGDDSTPYYSTINRTSNLNQTARLYCSGPLKRWFKDIPVGAQITVDVLSPITLRLSAR